MGSGLKHPFGQIVSALKNVLGIPDTKHAPKLMLDNIVVVFRVQYEEQVPNPFPTN